MYVTRQIIEESMLFSVLIALSYTSFGKLADATTTEKKNN